MATKWIHRTALAIALLSFSLLAFYLPTAYPQQNTPQGIRQQGTPQQQQQAIPLQILPKDNAGNVDWVKSLNQGVIKPLESLDPNKPSSPVIDLDIVFKVKGELPDVVYPHYPHTQWLARNNCHPKII